MTLTLQNFENILAFQNKTHKNFSQTLNIMIDQWDEYSLLIQKIQRQQDLDNLAKAEVIK